jgi:hypothetical protein
VRRSVLSVLAVIGVTATLLAGAPAHAASYRDPLTRGDLVTYNRADYRLSIAAVPGAKKVVRYGHSVPATYRVRMIKPGKRSDTVVYSATLGYSRTAYLRIKTVSVDVVRDYSMATYLKKVTSFSAAYAKKRVDAFTVEYRHRIQRGDVAATIPNAKAYVAAHGSADGIGTAKDVAVKSDGYFGYDRVLIRLYRADAYQDGASPDDFIVYGFDPADGYQVMYSSYTGLTRTARTEDSLALLA